jgi:neural Wiskott-Aldrich syndrome protein
MSDLLPPPTYSQEHPDDGSDLGNTLQHPQLLIVPTVDSINFQKGFLGAEGERAAIEGELQIKGADASSWSKLYVVYSQSMYMLTKE